jgi:nucleoid DNA-binding protein
VSKTELIKQLADITGDSQEKTRAVVNALQLLAWRELREGGVFAIADLVKIEAVDRAARSGESMGVKWHKPAHRGLRAKIIGRAKRMFES